VKKGEEGIEKQLLLIRITQNAAHFSLSSRHEPKLQPVKEENYN